jgi:hypothetical protein
MILDSQPKRWRDSTVRLAAATESALLIAGILQ